MALNANANSFFPSRWFNDRAMRREEKRVLKAIKLDEECNQSQCFHFARDEDIFAVTKYFLRAADKAEWTKSPGFIGSIFDFVKCNPIPITVRFDVSKSPYLRVVLPPLLRIHAYPCRSIKALMEAITEETKISTYFLQVTMRDRFTNEERVYLGNSRSNSVNQVKSSMLGGKSSSKKRNDNESDEKKMMDGDDHPSSMTMAAAAEIEADVMVFPGVEDTPGAPDFTDEAMQAILVAAEEREAAAIAEAQLVNEESSHSDNEKEMQSSMVHDDEDGAANADNESEDDDDDDDALKMHVPSSQEDVKEVADDEKIEGADDDDDDDGGDGKEDDEPGDAGIIEPVMAEDVDAAMDAAAAAAAAAVEEEVKTGDKEENDSKMAVVEQTTQGPPPVATLPNPVPVQPVIPIRSTNAIVGRVNERLSDVYGSYTYKGPNDEIMEVSMFSHDNIEILVDLVSSAAYTWKHRAKLRRFGMGLCIHCYRRIPYKKIREWIDDNETAICPKCGIDGIVPNIPKYELTPLLLHAWHHVAYGWMTFCTICSPLPVVKMRRLGAGQVDLRRRPPRYGIGFSGGRLIGAPLDPRSRAGSGRNNRRRGLRTNTGLAGRNVIDIAGNVKGEIVVVGKDKKNGSMYRYRYQDAPLLSQEQVEKHLKAVAKMNASINKGSVKRQKKRGKKSKTARKSKKSDDSNKKAAQPVRRRKKAVSVSKSPAKKKKESTKKKSPSKKQAKKRTGVAAASKTVLKTGNPSKKKMKKRKGPAPPPSKPVKGVTRPRKISQKVVFVSSSGSSEDSPPLPPPSRKKAVKTESAQKKKKKSVSFEPLPSRPEKKSKRMPKESPDSMEAYMSSSDDESSSDIFKRDIRDLKSQAPSSNDDNGVISRDIRELKRNIALMSMDIRDLTAI